MRIFLCSIILSLLTIKAYGMHNLLINGSPFATVLATESFDITATSEQPGAIANGTIYLDANNNGLLDPSDIWLYKIRLIDGGFDDEDEAANTNYRQIYDPFNSVGKFIFYAEDNGISDTAALTVNSVTSAYSISGKITNPANQPNLLVCLVDIIDMTTMKVELKLGDFTNNTGDYFICIPEDEANRWWNLAVIDPACLLPYYGSNDPVNDSIFVLGNVTKDLAMRYCGSDTTVVYGVLRDNLGNPITEPTTINGGGWIETIGYYLRPAKTDNSGAFRVYFPQAGSFRGYGYQVSASTAVQFYPELMNTLQLQSTGMGPSPILINSNLTTYRTDTTISGNVSKTGTSYDRCELECGAVGFGGNYTQTYSDGYYEMPISHLVSQYTMRVASKSIPSNYSVAPEDTIVPPGATGVNFTLTMVGSEEAYIKTKITLSAYPNPFKSKTTINLLGSNKANNLLIYDITGKCVAEVKPDNNNKFIVSQKLASATYFYYLKVGSIKLSGKIVKL